MSLPDALLNFAPFAALVRWAKPAPFRANTTHFPEGPRHFIQARFLNKSEVVVLDQLRKAVPDCDVFTQVALGALVQPPSHWPAGARQQSWRKYQGSIIDFVVWDPAEEQVLCLVELQSRDSSETKARDAFRDAITGEAGYPLLRLRKGENFDEGQLRERLFDAIDRPPNPTDWANERLARAALAQDGIEVS